MKKILVLGCGPAGLLAAHAATQEGWSVEIISKRQPSFIAGAQYLHTQIEGITKPKPDGTVSVFHLGDERVYAQKIYQSYIDTSWDRYKDLMYDVWNLQAAYSKLWHRYYPLIQDGTMMPGMVDTACREYEAVFSTVPLRSLFPEAEYKSVEIWVAPSHLPPPMTITYNGTLEEKWCRASNIFHHGFYEYPGRCEKPDADAVKITKPLSAHGYHPPLNFFPMGRYGKWQKGVLVDDAYREARHIARNL